MNVFVCSDKQGSGKTFITAGLAATMQSLGYKVGYFKPIQLGALNNAMGFLTSPDVTFVKKIDPNLITTVSYAFATDAIPTLASEQEKIEIKPQILIKDYIKLRKSCEIVFVEAWGDLLTPICDEIQTSEFVQTIQAPIVLIVEPYHDTFEKICLIANTAKHLNIKIAGIILNKAIKSSDLNVKKLPELIEYYLGIPIVGIVGYQNKITPSTLIDTVLHSIDIETIFGMSIPKLNSFTDK